MITEAYTAQFEQETPGWVSKTSKANYEVFLLKSFETNSERWEVQVKGSAWSRGQHKELDKAMKEAEDSLGRRLTEWKKVDPEELNK